MLKINIILLRKKSQALKATLCIIVKPPKRPVAMAQLKVARRPVTTTHTAVMVKLLTESGDSGERLSPDPSPRLNDEGAALYNKYLAPPPPVHSQFLKDVKKLLDYYEPFFPLDNTEPNFWPDLWGASEAWRQKKAQLKELGIQYYLASVTCEDGPLLNYCRVIASIRENILLDCYGWNFVSVTKDLLQRYMFNAELMINLLPFRDDKSTLQQKYDAIKCHFVLVKRRMKELNDELHASTNYHAVQARIAGYLQDLSDKQKEIDRLKAKEEAAEKGLAASSALLERKNGNEDEELVRLRARCEQLEQLLEEANDDKKLLADENRLLTQKLSLYEEEGEVVRRQSPELESDAPEDLQGEVARLRAELKQAREELARKERELEELRDHSRIDKTHDSTDENCVIAFTQAAQHSNTLYWKSQRLIKELKSEQFKISDDAPPISPAPSRC